MQSLMPPVDAPNNEFSDGNPSLGTLGTVLKALFLNNVQAAIRSVQSELLSVLAAAGINPDGDSNNQVLQAINKIMVSSNMSVPYGIPLPWPTNTPPAGYLICNGASFSAVTFPNLAAVYTNGVLPDLRGQTIKGLPASGRSLLSLEADGNKWHSHIATISDTDLGTKSTSTFDYGSKQTSTDGEHTHPYTTPTAPSSPIGGGSDWGVTQSNTGAAGNHSHSVFIGAHNHSLFIGSHGHAASISSEGNAENTVRNMAFHYIVRAA